MTPADWLLDGVLALVLPFLAWRVLTADDLPKAVVLFIAFGLLSALAWARLDAPDVALVEAAVGAGLTGALLMNTLGAISGRPRAPSLPARYRSAQALVVLALAAGLGWVVVALPDRSAGLTQEALSHLDRSGVSHPVTAVLLNFRGYDTLLEVAVLLVAAIGVRAIPTGMPQTHAEPDPVAPLLALSVRLLLPGLILVAGYLLWRGSHAPGGAFQAAAILTGGGVLLLLARVMQPPEMSAGVVKAALLAGPCLFLAVAAVPLLAGRRLLEYPHAWAAGLIFSVECALTLSIATMLIMFFPGAGGTARRIEPSTREEVP